MAQMLLGLEAERDALKARDLDALNKAMDTKTECLAKLAALASEIDGGASSGEEEGSAERREHVKILSEQCRDLNLANGLLISGQQRFVAGALTALHVETGDPATYGPDGTNRQSEKLRKHRASV